MASDGAGVDARLPRFGEGGDGACPSSQRATAAQRVNALDVYEDAVQEPLLECANLASMYYNAQPIGSLRPEARVLREDFCSSAVVAQTWLGLHKQNRAQGVDIDLEALRVARRRLAAVQRAERNAVIVQSSSFSQTGKVRRLSSGEVKADAPKAEQTSAPQPEQASTSTWAKGAASDRFERRFQARLAKERRSTAHDDQGEDADLVAATGDVLVLQHADVLSLPLPDVDVEAPDLVYAGNYALSYFHTRSSLLAYLRQCRRTLRKRTGVLIVDPFAGPTSWDARTPSEREEQRQRWQQFSQESGFLRPDEGQRPPAALHGDAIEFWNAPSSSETASSSSSHWRHWPRGRLVLVRRGHVGGGYEYWREDGPLDYATNRFRMSLSFRFTEDNSWLRDYFSYDFRVWSLCEIVEAMQEAGFERVGVHAIPRSTADKEEKSKEKTEETEGHSSASSDSGDDDGDDDDIGLDGMAALMKNTEKQEAQKSTYQALEPSQKLFATQSFGTYIVACMPSDETDE